MNNFSRFSNRAICILANVSQLGQLGRLGGESGWGRPRGDGHEHQQVFLLQLPSILTTDSATLITKCHPRYLM